MIDFDRPMRIVRSKRQVFVTGWYNGWRLLDTTDTGRGTGTAFNSSGEPVTLGHPWGAIENFDPSGDVFVSTEWVDPKDAINTQLREKRAAEFAVAAERDNSSNPLWGMF